MTSGVLNAVTYGIDNTGLSDVTAAVTAFLTEAASTDKIAYFPPGTYTMQNVSVPAGATITGAGDQTVLLRTGTAASSAVLRVLTNDVTIRDLAVDGNGAAPGSSNAAAIQASDVSDLTVERVHVRNTFYSGISISNPMARIRIVNNELTEISQGHTSGAGIGCVNDQAQPMARDVEVSHNAVVMASAANNGYGIVVAGGGGDNTVRNLEDVRIIGNRVKLATVTTTTPICIEAWCDHAVIANNDLWGGGKVWGAQWPLQGISNIGSHVSITGNTIRDVGLGIEATSGSHTHDVVVAGNTILNCIRGIASWLDARRVTIIGNTVNGFEKEGIGGTLHDGVVCGNVLYGAIVEQFGNGYGVLLDGGERTVVSGNMIRVGQLANSTAYGIRANSTTEFAIVGNVVIVADNGVSVNGTSPTVHNGVICGNDLRGAQWVKIEFVGTSTVGEVHRFANAGVRPIVSGSRGGNAALTDLLAELAAMGVIQDSTSA